jgi:PIN domain nuclease of toxin-antitoxin system
VDGAARVIVLDTAVWVWWVSEPDRLTATVRRTIEAEEDRHGLVVSAISVWEVGVKVALRKLVLDRDVRSWIALASSYPGITVHPLTAHDALESTLLPPWAHRDPADRMLVAVARRLGAPLVTPDRAIRRYRHVTSIW